jgi:hypothetical protein
MVFNFIDSSPLVELSFLFTFPFFAAARPSTPVRKPRDGSFTRPNLPKRTLREDEDAPDLSAKKCFANEGFGGK